ncbi:MAG: aminotransferase class IV [Deltaproteobacteria bacterium]
MDKKNFVYLNGSIAAEKRALISVFDRGFNYGDGVFETIKAINAKPIFLYEHLQRMKQGIKAMGIRQVLLKNLFQDIKNNAIDRLVRQNNLGGCASAVRITVSRGTDPFGYMPGDSTPATVITCRPIDAKLSGRLQEKGVEAVFLRDLSPVLPGVKSLNFLPNILGKKQAGDKKAFEGLFVNRDNMVTEGTATNIFIVAKSTLYTAPAYPVCPIHEGALNGVIRSKVILVARRLNIKVKEAFFCERDLINADEAFLTNSIIDVVPLVAIEKKPIKNGCPGEITKRIQCAISALSKTR